jgi:hypothetical protein
VKLTATDDRRQRVNTTTASDATPLKLHTIGLRDAKALPMYASKVIRSVCVASKTKDVIYKKKISTSYSKMSRGFSCVRRLEQNMLYSDTANNV